MESWIIFVLFPTQTSGFFVWNNRRKIKLFFFFPQLTSATKQQTKVTYHVCFLADTTHQNVVHHINWQIEMICSPSQVFSLVVEAPSSVPSCLLCIVFWDRHLFLDSQWFRCITLSLAHSCSELGWPCMISRQEAIFCFYHYIVETTLKVESTSTGDFGRLDDLDVSDNTLNGNSCKRIQVPPNTNLTLTWIQFIYCLWRMPREFILKDQDININK